MSDPRSEIRAAFQRRIDAAPMAPDLPWRAMEHAAGRAERRPLRFATLAAAGLALLVVVTLASVAVARQQHGRQTVPAAPVTTSPSPTTAPSPTASPAPAATSTPASSNPTFTTYRLPDANQDVGSMTAGPDRAHRRRRHGTRVRGPGRERGHDRRGHGRTRRRGLVHRHQPGRPHRQ